MTVEHVLNHVKKTHEYGNDISESLRKLEKVKTTAWEPTLKGSTKTDPDAKKTEERQFELKYKAELDEAMRRTKKFESNLCKASDETSVSTSVDEHAAIERHQVCVDIDRFWRKTVFSCIKHFS